MSSPAFLTFFGSVVAAVVTATYQALSIYSSREEKRNDRRIELQKLRREAYESYLTAYNQHASLYDFDPPPSEGDPRVIDAKNEYWRAYRGLFHVAPDEVLIAASDFHRFAWMGDYPDSYSESDRWHEVYVKQFRELYARMLGEMRRDAFGQTYLPLEMIEDRLPFFMPPTS